MHTRDRQGQDLQPQSIHLNRYISTQTPPQVQQLFEWKDKYSRTRLGVTGIER